MLPFEVQIRTHEMHLAAEYGIAAHWKYKLGGEKGGRRMDEWFAWARKLIEEQQSADDMEEFVRNLKNDTKQDIVVMTPHGENRFSCRRGQRQLTLLIGFTQKSDTE